MSHTSKNETLNASKYTSLNSNQKQSRPTSSGKQLQLVVDSEVTVSPGAELDLHMFLPQYGGTEGLGNMQPGAPGHKHQVRHQVGHLARVRTEGGVGWGWGGSNAGGTVE